jgi:prepilin peptidase CpaA
VIWEWIGEIGLAGVLMAAAVFDLRGGKVYNGLTYPAIVVGLVFGGVEGWWEGAARESIVNHLAGFGFGFAVLFVPFLLGGMGGGDVKLVGAVGAFLGWPGVVYAMFYSFLVGVAIGLILMVWRGRTATVLRRLGVAVRLLPLPGVTMDEALPVASLRVPFAFAVCVGTLWWVVEKEAGGSLYGLIGGLLGW